ncbi:hypothetical protein PVK06_009897 [Gossypium arboreum]|uniref:DUF4220 domain-containing protein n=1 Tax=Gossypium arboreum TaxID=29729 RepID=A0ABR0QP59_GOSAR|nr:hypothetical protein PVK06_009897 [Gossypium arboreum]
MNFALDKFQFKEAVRGLFGMDIKSRSFFIQMGSSRKSAFFEGCQIAEQLQSLHSILHNKAQCITKTPDANWDTIGWNKAAVGKQIWDIICTKSSLWVVWIDKNKLKLISFWGITKTPDANWPWNIYLTSGGMEDGEWRLPDPMDQLTLQAWEEVQKFSLPTTEDTTASAWEAIRDCKPQVSWYKLLWGKLKSGIGLLLKTGCFDGRLRLMTCAAFVLLIKILSSTFSLNALFLAHSVQFRKSVFSGDKGSPLDVEHSQSSSERGMHLTLEEYLERKQVEGKYGYLYRAFHLFHVFKPMFADTKLRIYKSLSYVIELDQTKHEHSQVDVGICNLLMGAAIFLEIYSAFLHLSSDWGIYWLAQQNNGFLRGIGSKLVRFTKPKEGIQSMAQRSLLDCLPTAQETESCCSFKLPLL